MTLESLSLLISSTVSYVLVISVLLFAYWYFYFPEGCPRGPIGLPVVGYLPFMGKRPQETLMNLGEKYGPVFSIYLGSKLAVVLNTYEAIHEAFVKNAEIFSGRPRDMDTNGGKRDHESIVNNDGKHWMEHRRFALGLLRNLGVGKSALEPQIMAEIHHFVEKVKTYGGQATDLRKLLYASIANNICILTLGKRFDYDDPWIHTVLEYLDRFIASGSSVAVFTFFPWIKKIPGMGKLALNKLQDNLDNGLEQQAKDYREGDDHGIKDHYIAAYVEEQKCRKKISPADKTFSDQGLVQNARLLYTAGTETTSNTLLWCIQYMMKHPEIQTKVQQELDRVIGTDRAPCCADRTRTPYTDAVIQEVQRLTTLVPLNAPHRNKETCKIMGKTIPKDSYIISNLWNCHMDKSLWNNPQNFRPERFLSPSGDPIKIEYLIPFSLGKRECLGIALAKMELYLYFTSLMQNFTFRSPNGIPVKLEARFGITYGPEEFKTCATPRDMH